MLKTIYINSEKITDKYIKDISVFQNSPKIELKEPITYFVGENGSGKSTLLENIASSFGFNKEGGTKNSQFKTNNIENENDDWIQLSWSPKKLLYGYFFRAESIFNFINYLEELPNGFSPYGGQNLHKNSHGEQFIKILYSQIDNIGFYILDEIESALSPTNQIKAVEIIKHMVKNGSQFLISTHSPIILGIKENSQILSLDFGSMQAIEYDMVPCVDMYKRILLK